MKTLPYTVAELETAVDNALAASHYASSVDEDVYFDVRYAPDRGLYIIETEYPDAGEMIYRTKFENVSVAETAADLYDELLERASL